MKREWFKAQVTERPDTADLFIFGDIGRSWWDDDDTVTAADFVKVLAALPATVATLRVRINSNGGDVFEGVSICNALRDQRTSHGRSVEVIIEGLAASVASVVAMAGSKITMADNAMMMIHAPWSLTVGNAADHRAVADNLDRIQNAAIVTAYRWHTKLSDEELLAAIAAETWYGADEAIAAGFATDKIEGLQVAAALDPRTTAKLKVPAQYRDRVAALVRQPAAPAPTPATDPALTAADTRAIVAACEAGAALDLVPQLLADNASLDQARARISSLQASRRAATERENAIRSICKHSPYLKACANPLVASGVSLDVVKALALEVHGAVDSAIQIDGTLSPDSGNPRGRVDTVATIYDRFNKQLQPSASA